MKKSHFQIETGATAMKIGAAAILAGCFLWLSGIRADDEKADYEVTPEMASRSRSALPATIEEARGRARWLHELIHGSLQVMHRDFFGDGDDESLALPSQSLDDVFEEMARTWQVEIRWLGVNAMKGVDHRPKDRFEEAAAKALEAGEPEYEAAHGGEFRFAGAIAIKNQCLKCHDRNRTSLDEKVAGLVISFPIAQPELAKSE